MRRGEAMGDTPLEKILESSMSSESSSCKYMREMIRPRLSGESNSPRMAPRDRGCGFPISRSAWSSSSASSVARRLWISSLFVRRRLLNMISRLSSGTEPKVLLGRCSTASMNSSSATIFNICIQLTCSRAASSQTSSLFGQCSQPALMSVLTATIQTGGSHPLWGVLRVRFDEGIEEHSGPLDITDLSLGLDSHAVQGCEVSLWIDGSCCPRGRARHLVQFERPNLVTSLSNLDKVGQSSGIPRSLESLHGL